MTDAHPTPAVSRRRLLGYAGAGAAVGAAGFAGGMGTARATDATAGTPTDRYPFHGRHQAGIVTPGPGPAALRRVRRHRDLARRAASLLLKAWTAAAAAMTQGRPVGGRHPAALRRPRRGHRRGVRPAAGRLTLTFGFGPSLFRDADGKDRFGLADRQPTALRRLPHFPADALDRARSDGDLCVQACADDPQVAVHAIRNLSRIAFGTRGAALVPARLRPYVVHVDVAGHAAQPASASRTAPPTSRPRRPSAVDEHVWVADGDDDGADWLTGGSLPRGAPDQHAHRDLGPHVAARAGDAGRPRPSRGGAAVRRHGVQPTRTSQIQGNDGQPLIATSSHVRLAHPSQNGGVRMLRRGYNFTDGNDDLGRLDAGLFFIAYVRDPDRQYVPMQNKLSRDDGLMEYLQHTGSALFAVPPGVRAGGFVGDTLFA